MPAITGFQHSLSRFSFARALIAIEAKIKPNRPTELQRQYLQEVYKRGGIALVAYDLEDVIRNKDLV